MSRLLPDLMEGHRAQTARLAIGEDLVITWAYEEDGGPNSLGRRLVFTATEADGTRLGVMAVVPVFTPEGSVPGSVVAEVLQGTSAPPPPGGSTETTSGSPRSLSEVRRPNLVTTTSMKGSCSARVGRSVPPGKAGRVC